MDTDPASFPRAGQVRAEPSALRRGAAARPGGRAGRHGPLAARCAIFNDDVDFLPGDGPTSGISVTLTAGTLQAIRERVGKRGVSAYLEKAAQRQIERDNLDELIADFEEVHGPADPEAVAAKRARLTGGASSAGVAA
ncbi:hypothetical protein GCM10010377_12240 [Streptomyces viridiviolaceus]|nr:hypothetical protein GCM10010377_12240 [Streptomyces viridiviolaceus]